MALLKLNGQITSISGTCGGDIYKRDASGQHITAKQRHVKKPKSQKQLDQMAWYNQLKREERAGGPPEPDEPEPEDPATILIYSASDMSFTRQRTIYPPTTFSIPIPADPLSEAGNWITQNWNIFILIPGIEYELVWQVLMKYWYTNMFTHGLIPSEALALAKVETITWAETMIPKAGMARAFTSFLGNSLLLTGCLVYYFFSKINYTHSFSTGQSVVNLNGTWSWCELIGRPSNLLYDFLIGPPLPITPLISWYEPVREGGFAYRLTWSKLVQTLYPYAAWFDVFIWGNMNVYDRIPAYQIGPNVYRGELSPYSSEARLYPIGWSNPGPYFTWIDSIFHHW